MSENNKKNTAAIGIVGEGKSKLCTLASLLANFDKKGMDDVGINPTLEGIDAKKPVYILSSVFPSKEVQNIALDEVDRCNKRDLCKSLGIVYENIDDVSWDEIISVIEKDKKPKKGKLLSKVMRKGV